MQFIVGLIIAICLIILLFKLLSIFGIFLIFLLDKFFYIFPSGSSIWAWTIGGFILGSIIYFAIHESGRLSRPKVKPALLIIVSMFIVIAILVNLTKTAQQEISNIIAIPSLRARIISVKFFETEKELINYDKRTYRKEFERSRTRFIAWEINLEYPTKTRQTGFEIMEIWYSPNGTRIYRNISNSSIERNWNNSYHAGGYGNSEWGKAWQAGIYKVELYIDGAMIGTYSFKIY